MSPKTATPILTAALSTILISGTAPAQPGAGLLPRGCCPVRPAAPVIQLAICLDTSGSMDGLIHQARTRIWSIVNELSGARRCGIGPRLEVAVYQYGSDHHPASEQFAACVLPFTGDLDAVSEALFSLSVAGSNEYCGAVIRSAAQQLEWTATGEGALRLMVIAGNEPFTQGPVPYQSAVTDAVERGIVISTVYCGRDEEGQATGWLHAAHLSGGDYAVIDHDRVLIDIRCPQDERLHQLNARLNGTYLSYGVEGPARAARQREQDSRLADVSVADFAERVTAKADAQVYRHTGWDLVDLYAEEGAAGLGRVDASTLPAGVRGLSPAALEERVRSLADERASIQREIQSLSAERERYLESERARLGESTEGTLDDALLGSIRRHAEAAGFDFEG